MLSILVVLRILVIYTVCICVAWAPEEKRSCMFLLFIYQIKFVIMNCCVAEPHHFYAALTPGKNFDAAPALTILNTNERE
jgi:hypothetical protein